MFPDWYPKYKNFVSVSIEEFINSKFSKRNSKPLEILKEATLYSIKWWKRLRAILALEFFLIYRKKELKDLTLNDDITKFVIALEIIHAFSLVHDDMPAMDDDEYRRGNLTTRKKYNEYTALLVGDLCNTLPFEILSSIEDKKVAIDLIRLLSKSIWFYGMIWWQMEDLYYEIEEKKLNISDLKSLQAKKTWALIKASSLWWWILAWVDNSILNKIEKYANSIGLAFQIKDDLLDVEWDLETTGKSVWWENKWFVYSIWLEESKKYLNKLIEKSLELANFFWSEKLEFITLYIKDRVK